MSILRRGPSRCGVRIALGATRRRRSLNPRAGCPDRPGRDRRPPDSRHRPGTRRIRDRQRPQTAYRSRRKYQNLPPTHHRPRTLPDRHRRRPAGSNPAMPPAVGRPPRRPGLPPHQRHVPDNAQPGPCTSPARPGQPRQGPHSTHAMLGTRHLRPLPDITPRSTVTKTKSRRSRRPGQHDQRPAAGPVITPAHSECRRPEVPVHQVRVPRMRRIRDRGPDLPRPPHVAPPPVCPHQPLHRATVMPSSRRQVRPGLHRAVQRLRLALAIFAGLEHARQQPGQPRIAHRPPRRRPRPPRPVRPRRDPDPVRTKCPAHRDDAEPARHRGDERADHRRSGSASRAKKRVASVRIAIVRSSSDTFRRSARTSAASAVLTPGFAPSST
jgi:hypothetical protein